jgi:hypothetical protein
MEFKLKLCFQNDLIRFIGDKLDKKSKLILVCMRYFILIEISYFRLLGGKQIVYFLIKEMVALDGKISNRYFSLNTLKV